MARPPKGSPNKSDFVRNLPAELSAAQVVEKAKEAGLVITPIFVYKVRSRDKAAGDKKAPKAVKAVAKPAKKGPAKKAAAPVAASGSFKTASDYIRAQPVDRPVAEIVAEGRGLGLKVSPSLVYTLQGQKRKGAKGSKKPVKAVKVAAPKAVKAPKAAPKAAVAAAPTGAEAQFRKLVLELGVANAKALVSEVEGKLSALLAGR